ncbi:MAG: ACP S-malonyltransferase [Lachnospiraceae bacterium]|nr:ACP S-malonyltransferase [Lachnospiraceae bacterium]
MDHVAFLFSGQGDQFSGMGKDLLKYAEAAAVFDACDRLRPGTSQMCFEGPEEELKKTVNTQPCLFAFEMAASEILMKHGIWPEAAAGFSLGEISAATAAGVFGPEDGFRTVCERAVLMQQAAEGKDMSMAAVLKLPHEKVKELAALFPEIWPVNFNCPGQTSVSGDALQMKKFIIRAREAGGRAVMLKVSGAFHSPLMTPAAEAFRTFLDSMTPCAPKIRLWSDRTGREYEQGAEEIRRLLAEQIDHPVLFEDLIRDMAGQGIATFVEIGPGKTLTHLVQRICPEKRALTFMEFKEECGI